MYAWMYDRIFQFQEYIHVLSMFMYPRGHVAVQSDPRSGPLGPCEASAANSLQQRPSVSLQFRG